MIARNRIGYSLVFGLFFISLGGAMIHYHAHPSAKHDFAYVPMVAGILSVLVIPPLFLFKRTLHLAYMLNGFLVIVGTVTMGHYALVSRPIWPDLPILWAKFLMGYALFNIEVFSAAADLKLDLLKAIRYPHFGFWVVHLLTIGTVYTLGAMYWR